jgi:hypothetical protein
MSKIGFLRPINSLETISAIFMQLRLKKAEKSILSIF